MWRFVSVLGLAGFCLAVPAPQGGSLSDLINGIYGPGNKNTSSTTSTPSPDALNGLITGIFGQPTGSTTQGPILGTQNKPKVDETCECVPYYQCRDGVITETGIGLLDVRLGKCASYLDVCCKPPSIREPQEKLPDPKPTQRVGCGKRNPGGVAFRITGQTENEAQFGEFPWMVAILREESINDKKLKVYQCGGALIHRQAVLTAAHCVQSKQPSELKVRAGEWDTQTNNETYPHQDRDVTKVIVHSEFDSGPLFNDYAILILNQPVDFAENVDVVCLPEATANFNEGSGCFVSGWGKDFFGKEGHYQVILKRIEMPLVPRDTCQNTFRSTRLGKYFKLHESFICAGGQAGKDACTGDGGSPLVCPIPTDPTRYVQAGIVAWGIGCGEDRIPGAYANIAHARKWIDETMQDNNLDINEYQYRP